MDKFLANQKQIWQDYPSSEIIIATTEKDFAKELEYHLRHWKLKSKVLIYDVVKPDNSHSTIWNIACGREAIRQHMLNHTNADGLLFLDADMTYDPRIIKLMTSEWQKFDAVFSGSARKNFGIGLAGAGCLLLKRAILKKIKFRCYEFNNGEIIHEDTTLEMDIFQVGGRIKKGFFVAIDHYLNSFEFRSVAPQKVGLLKALVNNSFIRYCLISISILIHYNIPEHVKIRFKNF